MAEATTADKDAVRKLIVDFYKFAGIPITSWDGTVNDGVANVFNTIYRETVKCSKAMAWVPEPPMGPPGIPWLAAQLAGAAFKRFQGRLSQTCARQAISLHNDDFLLAAMGVSSLRFAKWA